MELTALILEGAKLKAELDAIQIKLKDINQQIYEQTAFPEDKNTVNTKAGNITAKIQRRRTYAWDQAKLNAARELIGEEQFLDIFSFQWKASKKKLDGFLESASPEQKRPIMDALTIKPSFAVSYEVSDV